MTLKPFMTFPSHYVDFFFFKRVKGICFDVFTLTTNLYHTVGPFLLRPSQNSGKSYIQRVNFVFVCVCVCVCEGFVYQYDQKFNKKDTERGFFCLLN